jgi:tetratricopeptide (TPR) repeat protein
MSDFHSNLDVEELLHVALTAVGRADNQTAISSLKRAVELQPDHAQAHFLLGAQYAEIGMPGRAIEEMSVSLQIEPNLEMARFQLGLLLLTVARVDEASEVWQPFDALEATHPLHLFKKGLLCMVRDEFDDARMFLREGIARNTVNPALNRDMANVIAHIDQAVAELKAPADEGGESDAEQHIGVSAYKAG